MLEWFYWLKIFKFFCFIKKVECKCCALQLISLVIKFQKVESFSSCSWNFVFWKLCKQNYRFQFCKWSHNKCFRFWSFFVDILWVRLSIEMKAVRYAGAGGEIWLPAKYLYNVSFNTIHRQDHCIGKIWIPVRFKNTKSVLFVTFMQRERHEKGILRRPQPGLDHKTSLCEQKRVSFSNKRRQAQWAYSKFIYFQQRFGQLCLQIE